MLKTILPKELRIVILLITTVAELQANAIKSEISSDVNEKERELAKRGLGAPNDYGPAIKITSNILQLTKTAEGSTTVGDLQHHEATLEQGWPAAVGYQLPVTPTIWLELPSVVNQPDFQHLPIVPVLPNNHHFLPQPQNGEGTSIASGGVSVPEVTAEFSKGLHTQVISSSGKDVIEVSDNLDFGEGNKDKLKRKYRVSYGR